MIRTKIYGLLLASGLAASVSAQENYAQWTGHQRLWLNTQLNGADVGATVTNFPVLVRLTTAQTAIFSQAKAGGADIRFSKADTVTKLRYQIERWDTAAKAAEIWVLVDSVKGNNGTQSILMHWGRPAAFDSSNGAAVFQTANGFQAVYHFNQAAANPALDATANALNGTPTSVTDAAGAIGPGKSFDGSASWYDIQNSATGPVDFASPGTFTISAWVNATVANSGTHYEIVSKHDRQYALKIHSSGNFEFFEFNGGWTGPRAPMELGVWKHLVGVANAGVYQLWVDGLPFTELTTVTNTGASGAGLTNLSIGKRGDNSTRFYNGLLDEVNLSSVARSADWVKLSYQNQKAAQSLVAFTAPVALRGGEKPADGRMQVKVQGSGLLFSLPGGAAPRARLSLVDMWGRTVWNRTVAVSSNPVYWNGQGNGGKPVPSGVYVARIVLLDAAGHAGRTLERKVPLTR